MTDVLGLPLDRATDLTSAQGKSVRLVEVRSKKGGKGDDRRVIRCTEEDGTTVLYWSAFQTTIQD